MLTFSRTLALATLLVLLATPAAPISDGGLGRPAVGLALGGGGARGFAHVGVLLWLEDHRIPVDCIAGTSMGGLVGAIYASGVSAPEIRRTVVGTDWDAALAAAPSLELLTFRRKEDRREFPNGIRLGLRHGLGLPSGLSPAHFAGLVLCRLTFPCSDVGSFDDLPIPFRSVAVDLVDGNTVVSADGSLIEALRATMAIPGVFTPVEGKGDLLVDGGLLNGLPADVSRGMGADVVIAVDVEAPQCTDDSLDTIADILSRSISVVVRRGSEGAALDADILVTVPGLEEYGVFSYGKADTIIRLGYEAAAAQAERLAPLALDPAQWAEHLARREARRPPVAMTPAFVEVIGARARRARQMEERLRPFVGHELDPAELERALDRIYGWGVYDRLTYEKVRREGREGLRVRAVKKRYAPPFLDVGLTVVASNPGDIEIQGRGRITALDVWGTGSEWRIDGGLGSTLTLGGEFYQPLAAGAFLAPRVEAMCRSTDLYADGSRVAEYEIRTAAAELALGVGVRERTDEVRLGCRVGREETSVLLGVPDAPPVEGTLRSWFVRWAHDGQNSASVPTRGLRGELVGTWFEEAPDIQERFGQVRMAASMFAPLGGGSSLFGFAILGTSFDRSAPPVRKFALGGLFQLGAYNRDELRGDRVRLGGVGYLRRLSRGFPLLGGATYAASWLEVGDAWNRGQAPEDRVAGSAGAVMDSFVGPVFVGGSVGDHRRANVWVSIGRLF